MAFINKKTVKVILVLILLLLGVGNVISYLQYDRALKDKELSEKQHSATKKEFDTYVAKAQQEIDSLNKSLQEHQELIIEKSEQIALLEKEKKIQELELIQKQLEIEKQRLKTNALMAVSVLLLFIALLFIVRYREKKKANQKIRSQKLLLEEKQRDIHASITYARSLQQALLPAEDEFKQIIPEAFVLYEPKDIVGGDFYWVGAIPNTEKVLFVCADCTGHGVPGALLSTMGYALLNEIVYEKGITQPSKILDQLRKAIISNFQHGNGEAANQDGMDMAVCLLDKTSRNCVFSGANRPLYRIRKGSLEVFKGDKLPVGQHINSHQQFADHTIELEPEDMVYIFSDGFADQFGGPGNKKFSPKRLKELLTSNWNQPLDFQKSTFLKAIQEWKGKEEQIDDISMIGVRYS